MFEGIATEYLAGGVALALGAAYELGGWRARKKNKLNTPLMRINPGVLPLNDGWQVLGYSPFKQHWYVWDSLEGQVLVVNAAQVVMSATKSDVFPFYMASEGIFCFSVQQGSISGIVCINEADDSIAYWNIPAGRVLGLNYEPDDDHALVVWHEHANTLQVSIYAPGKKDRVFNQKFDINLDTFTPVAVGQDLVLYRPGENSFTTLICDDYKEGDNPVWYVASQPGPPNAVIHNIYAATTPMIYVHYESEGRHYLEFIAFDYFRGEPVWDRVIRALGRHDLVGWSVVGSIGDGDVGLQYDGWFLMVNQSGQIGSIKTPHDVLAFSSESVLGYVTEDVAVAYPLSFTP